MHAHSLAARRAAVLGKCAGRSAEEQGLFRPMCPIRTALQSSRKIGVEWGGVGQLCVIKVIYHSASRSPGLMNFPL